MHRRVLALAAAAALTASVGITSAAAGNAAGAQPESFIVVLDTPAGDVRAEAAALGRQAGGRVGFVYEHALQGFQLWASPRAAEALRNNPNVVSVESDDLVTVAEQSTPTGVERIDADSNAALDIDGVDDLRVDVDTIGALDNGTGVVGVAPGARLWAVKVLDANGSGWESQIVAGIDWVAANADTIEVANMSLGGSGYSAAEYQAIQGAVDRGVAFAVAAGNESDLAANYSPAAFDNALTVSALADFDGLPGGAGAATCRNDEDDTLANFSNYGDAVQIAAPGVCIESTYPLERGTYATISGTSMASPHVAGALAMLASTSNPVSAADVAGLYGQVIAAGNDGWTDESGDGSREPLLDVAGFGAAMVGGGGPTANTPPQARFIAACTDLACAFDASSSSDDDGDGLTYAWDFGDGTDGSGAITNRTYSAAGTYTVELTVTDGRGGEDSATQVVTPTSGGSPGSGVELTGDATSSGRTWTATVTVSGGATQGTWSTGAAGGCDPGAGSCDFSVTVRKNVPSVTYTDASDPAVSITVKG